MVLGGGITKGYADGFMAKYNDSTHVDIAAGIYETGGKIITLAADANYLLTSIPLGFDWIYIYLDKSASTSTSPSFYNGTDEPVFSPAKRGWYHPTNTEDRLVSPVATSTIKYFDTVKKRNLIRQIYGSTFPAMSANLIPDTAWDSPSLIDGDVITPVNAKEMAFRMVNSGGTLQLFAASKEYGDQHPALADAAFWTQQQGFCRLQDWLMLSNSRKIYLAGVFGDNNFLNITCQGVGFER